jgi:acetoin utilization deacetylase AcuC-like enzyme
MTTAYITHSRCFEHEMTPGHPESPQRLWAIRDALIQARLMDFLTEHDAIEASEQQICRVHTKQLYDKITQSSPEQGLSMIDPDTYMNIHSLQAALLAAGAVVLASDLVMQKKVSNAFCAVRPPGHHAESARAMGFCFFNNIAVGVAHVLATYSLKRVAIVDFDVHHGNGTEDIFRDEERVLFCSSYQHPFYPHSGATSTSGHLINTKLPAGTGGEIFREAISQDWIPELHAFKPEMIFISAGFDAHKLDDMAQLNLLEEDYAWVTQEIMQIAERYAKGRIVSSLEGGYHLGALGRSAAAHIKVLMNLH